MLYIQTSISLRESWKVDGLRSKWNMRLKMIMDRRNLQRSAPSVIVITGFTVTLVHDMKNKDWDWNHSSQLPKNNNGDKSGM